MRPAEAVPDGVRDCNKRDRYDDDDDDDEEPPDLEGANRPPCLVLRAPILLLLLPFKIMLVLKGWRGASMLHILPT